MAANHGSEMFHSCFTGVFRGKPLAALLWPGGDGAGEKFASNINGRGCRLPVFTGNLQGRSALPSPGRGGSMIPSEAKEHRGGVTDGAVLDRRSPHPGSPRIVIRGAPTLPLQGRVSARPRPTKSCPDAAEPARAHILTIGNLPYPSGPVKKETSNAGRIDPPPQGEVAMRSMAGGGRPSPNARDPTRLSAQKAR